jgi:sugar lactone lactonase YvrE
MKTHVTTTLLSLALCQAALICPFVHAQGIPNNPSADLVLGQPDFVTAVDGISAFTMDGPEGIAIDPVTRKVFVCEYSNNRVLRFPNVASLTNGANAEAVFGQVRFSDRLSTSLDPGLKRPEGIFFDRRGRLWVADRGNNRVLEFDAASYSSTNPYPDHVYGQPDFTTTASGITSAKMSAPTGVWVDAADRLWVVDQNNNRVLRFNSISTRSNGDPANGVLGQPNFTTNSSAITANGLDTPYDLSLTASGALYLADSGNNRVLRYDNAAALGNGAAANAVFGQPNFTTNTSSPTNGVTGANMDYPAGALITSNDTLWVSENNNSRILRFSNASTKTSGASADGVIGQPNLTTKLSATTAKGLNSPYNNAFVDTDGSLWTGDYINNRALRFSADFTKPGVAISTVVKKKPVRKNFPIAGTASDANGVASVRFNVNGGPQFTANGTTSWSATAVLKKGLNTINVFATDSVGNVSGIATLKVKSTGK